MRREYKGAHDHMHSWGETNSERAAGISMWEDPSQVQGQLLEKSSSSQADYPDGEPQYFFQIL